MFEWIYLPEAWVALGTLVALEIILGVDNIIFISVLVGRLPPEQRAKARKLGVLMALVARIGLLFGIVWIMGLIQPLFTVMEQAISGRDLILIGGGLFLLAKSTHEIHNSFEIIESDASKIPKGTFVKILVQIALLDLVFSLDSVITAVGLVEHVSIMVIAILISVLVMLLSAEAIGTFVDKNPTVKMLALSFLMLIGVTLMGEGLDFHIPKGYIYFSMAFALSVEFLNISLRRKKDSHAIKLKSREKRLKMKM